MSPDSTPARQTEEGFFADPVCGGNHDMASWRMAGHPGRLALYADRIEACRNRRHDVPPQPIADFW